MALIQTNGNKKIDSTVCTYSQTPIKTCPNCAGCCEHCYALKSYKQYPNVRASWDNNYKLSLENPNEFKRRAIEELTKSKKAYCRIHVSGDFYSVEYIQLWIDICKACPQIVFWTYTKADNEPNRKRALDELNSLPNVNIVKSTYNGKINFGTQEYIDALQAEIESNGGKVFQCPCGKDDTIKCGKNCHACSVYEYVLFLQH